MSSRETFGRGLAALRKKRGLTQAELADRIDVSTQFLTAIETGKKAPSFDSIDRIAKVLRTDAGEIFSAGRKEASTPPTSNAVLRATESLPSGHEEALVEVLQVVSRYLSTAAAEKAPRKRGTRKKTPATPRRKRA